MRDSVELNALEVELTVPFLAPGVGLPELFTEQGVDVVVASEDVFAAEGASVWLVTFRSLQGSEPMVAITKWLTIS
jgi:hypothetical protein